MKLEQITNILKVQVSPSVSPSVSSYYPYGAREWNNGGGGTDYCHAGFELGQPSCITSDRTINVEIPVTVYTPSRGTGLKDDPRGIHSTSISVTLSY